MQNEKFLFSIDMHCALLLYFGVFIIDEGEDEVMGNRKGNEAGRGKWYKGEGLEGGKRRRGSKKMVVVRGSKRGIGRAVGSKVADIFDIFSFF